MFRRLVLENLLRRTSQLVTRKEQCGSGDESGALFSLGRTRTSSNRAGAGDGAVESDREDGETDLAGINQKSNKATLRLPCLLERRIWVGDVCIQKFVVFTMCLLQGNNLKS